MAEKRKHALLKVSTIRRVQDVIEIEGCTSYLVRSRSGNVLFRKAKPIFQKYDRDVLNALTHRRINDEPCCSLNSWNVELQDNAAFLPLEGPSYSKDYNKLFLEYLQSVHGTEGCFKARDDLYQKLKRPMSLREFKNIYFHPFFQGEEELVEFPARVIDNLKPLTLSYKGRSLSWARAYIEWEKEFYKKEIDLIGSCMVDLLVFRVFQRGMNFLSNNAASEALLVRNIITHLNEWKLKRDWEPFDKTEIGELIHEIFPHISVDLFDFCQFCGVDLDFAKLRKFFKA